MANFKIIHDRPTCIGCGACVAVAPNHWVMNEDGKADIKGCEIKKNAAGEIIEEVLFVDDNKEDMDAAQSCPVNCIHIEDLKEKKKLI